MIAARAPRPVPAVLAGALIVAGSLLADGPSPAAAFPVHGDQTVLPVGSELNEDAIDRPRELFHSEANGGGKSYLVNLGDTAFSAPSLLGGVARRAGISCATCHVNGANNPKLYLPGLSTRPGNFDTTGALFNPLADNHVLDPVRVPSLRGARYLAPYGHDGRFASLRDFVRNVVVNEFAGPEPSPTILDALVAYLQDIDFLPNPKLDPAGRLSEAADAAARRGQALFSRPFPHDPGLSCAACHHPVSAYLDHQQHDVGSGGLFRTPTLINANFNAPYFHDGRFDGYDAVVDHFDRVFDLGLSPDERRDLVAFLTAVGDGTQPTVPDPLAAAIKEIDDFASTLDPAIAAGDRLVVDLVVDTVGGELRDLIEQFPDRRDTSVTGGLVERSKARTALKELVLALRRLALAAADGRTEDARGEYRDFRARWAGDLPALLRQAEPWSLFEPSIHDAHYTAVRALLRAAATPR